MRAERLLGILIVLMWLGFYGNGSYTGPRIADARRNNEHGKGHVCSARMEGVSSVRALYQKRVIYPACLGNMKNMEDNVYFQLLQYNGLFQNMPHI